MSGAGSSTPGSSFAIVTDGWLRWPVLTFLAAVGFFTLMTQISSIGWLILGLPICFLLAIALALAVLVSGFRKRPRQTISYLAALLAPVLLWRPMLWAESIAHLGLTVGLETGKLDSMGQDDPDFAVYDWSSGFGATFLVRDKSGEIALPPSQQKHPVSDEEGFVQSCAGNVSHLLGPYYICSF